MKIRNAVDLSSCPAIGPQNPCCWPALPDVQQREMDQAVAMLREAADQGHIEAQAVCWEVYSSGQGVAQDERLAFVYCERAAQEGHPRCECNTGVSYRDGLGCKQSFVQAAEWFEKAARHGNASAMAHLGE